MQDAYYTITGNSEGEYSEKGSKFIAYAANVTTVEEADEFVATIKKEHYKARHHCYAYRIGETDDIFRINDDGEPSGTAGRPIYGQILSAELRDIIIVVVRYFGGKLLGASGLITAYKAAAADAIENAERKTIHLRKLIKVEIPYTIEPFFMNALTQLEIDITARDYAQTAVITIAVPQSMVDEKLKEICAQVLNRKPSDIKNPFKCSPELNFTVLETEES